MNTATATPANPEPCHTGLAARVCGACADQAAPTGDPR